MKKNIANRLVGTIALTVVSAIASAQSLNVYTGQVCTSVNASADQMAYSADGTTVNIAAKDFTIADIDSIIINNDIVDDNTVTITYSGSTAYVVIAGNIAPYITATVSNADVSIEQSDDVDSSVGEITYSLSGTSTDGSFYLDGSYKATVEISDLTLTSVTNGAAVNIANGKRINMVLSGTSTLTDLDGGSQKGCLMINGHSEFSGDGTLNIYGQGTKHGIWTDEYLMTKKSFTGSINVLSATKDGMNINQYLEHRAGTISVSGSGDDGIQVGATDDTTDENNGQIIIGGGTIDISVTAEDVKGLKCDSMLTVSDTYSTPVINITCSEASLASKGIKSGGDMNLSAGTFTISTAGYGVWDSDDSETSACSAIKSDGILTISGGTYNLTATGSAGKGISCDSIMNVTGGDITITTSGGVYYNNGTTETINYTGSTDNISSSYKSSPKGIKVDQELNISGGTITVTTTGNGGECIESKGDMTISGGTIMAISAKDDAINSGDSDLGTGDLNITGGMVYAISAGNDGLDANGDMNISGGVVYAACSGSPEVALDANTEMNNNLYITGGTIITFGGIESNASVSIANVSTTASANTNYALLNGNTVIAAWKSPTSSYAYSSMSVYSGDLTSGTSYTLNKGCTLSGTSYFDDHYYADATVSGGSTSTLRASNSTGNTPGGNTPGGGGGAPGGM